MIGLGQLAFYFGGALVLCGLIVHLRHIRLCNRVVAATSTGTDGLQAVEVWLNLSQFRKRRKLKMIVSSEPPESDLRSWASSALKLEVLFYCFIVPGMILMAIGAALQN